MWWIDILHNKIITSRTVPVNRKCYWRIMFMQERRFSKFSWEMLCLSIYIRPEFDSITLSKHSIRLDLPLPVLPTIPIFSPPLIEILISFNTHSNYGLYLAEKLAKVMAPSVIVSFFCSEQFCVWFQLATSSL